MGIESQTVAPAALTPPIQHKTVLQFSDFSDDDQLYSVLASCEPHQADPAWPDEDIDSDLEDEVESKFGVETDGQKTMDATYLNQRSCLLDLQPATLMALAHLEAPFLADLDPDEAPGLRSILEGSSTPAYRVCRQHGVWERFFLRAARPIAPGEAIGVLVGRLVEKKRRKAEERAPKARGMSLRLWDIPAKELNALNYGTYAGPDLVLDLEAAANELVHLQDPFWEQEGYGGEQANAQLTCTLVFDSKMGVAVPTVVLKAMKAIRPGDMLTVSWKDEFWVKLSVRENMTAAATAWASLHLPLLRLRDLARRHGIPVSRTAPYYPEELREWKRMKEWEARRLATSSASLAAAEADSSYLATVVTSEGGRRRQKWRWQRFNRMFIDEEGSWYLDDGNGPQQLVAGPPHRGPSPPLPPTEEAFRAVSDAELEQMPYTTESDYSHVPEAVQKQLKDAAGRVRSLPAAELALIDSGRCPKLEVHEVIALHHPVRFLTRPDVRAYGAHVRPGAVVRPGEAVGVYVGEAYLGKDFDKKNDMIDSMYVYTMTAANVVECFGHSKRNKTAVKRFPTLMVDAGRAGNVTRFINDVYARPGAPQPTVEAQVTVDPRTGLPYMMVHWAAKGQPGEGWDELTVDYGSTGYWKVGGRALHRQLKAHAEVALIAAARLRAALLERGVDERVISAAAAPVDLSRETWYLRELDDDDDMRFSDY